jgi:hypothetical protein
MCEIHFSSAIAKANDIDVKELLQNLLDERNGVLK